ncbi:hypothetical protein E2C01_044570 [Portunus trituberculatus]|uniref:Uncharacterized protein n=1 Tax=Portunus trituberculatus TaxID=210409 RepID=A0A5B7FSI0_PORTR|nr:hypothetical protein [Portunus trituberculatus]
MRPSTEKVERSTNVERKEYSAPFATTTTTTTAITTVTTFPGQEILIDTTPVLNESVLYFHLFKESILLDKDTYSIH